MHLQEKNSIMHVHFLFTLIFSIIVPAAVIAQNIIISEVMFNPDGNENAREFVELYNAGGSAVSLEGWMIGDGEDSDMLVPADGITWLVPSKSYALVFDPDYFDTEELYNGIPEDVPLFMVDDKAIGSRGLSNSTAEPVLLFSADGDTISSVSYSLDCPPGHSWERIYIDGADNGNNFAPSDEPEGTPGRVNSAAPPRINPAITKDDITISPESVSMGDRVAISVRCRNAGTEAFANPRVTVFFQPGSIITDTVLQEQLNPGGISGEITCQHIIPGGMLSLTVIVDAQNASPESADDDTVTVALTVPITADTILLTEIMAAPLLDEPEWVEVMNSADVPVDMYGWSVLDESGAASDPVSSHVLLPGGSYAVLTEEFLNGYTIPDSAPVLVIDKFPPLNNNSDMVFLTDAVGEPLDSANWEDALSGISLERIDLIPDEGHGWDTCVNPAGATPGQDNSIVFTDVSEDVPDEISITIEPNPFEQSAHISYSLPFPLARVRLLVYDRRGRLAKTIRNVDESGSAWSGIWDGCDNNGSRLSAGPYILFFEAFDKRSGKMHCEKIPIVVARRL